MRYFFIHFSFIKTVHGIQCNEILKNVAQQIALNKKLKQSGIHIAKFSA